MVEAIGIALEGRGTAKGEVRLVRVTHRPAAGRSREIKQPAAGPEGLAGMLARGFAVERAEDCIEAERAEGGHQPVRPSRVGLPGSGRRPRRLRTRLLLVRMPPSEFGLR